MRMAAQLVGYASSEGLSEIRSRSRGQICPRLSRFLLKAGGIINGRLMIVKVIGDPIYFLWKQGWFSGGKSMGIKVG